MIHKSGLQKVEKYIGLGQYVQVVSPLCVGAKGLYSGNSYFLSYLWRNVTCKHCLKKKNNKPEELA